MPLVAVVGETVQTRGEVTFEWKITDFFSLSDRVDNWYGSNFFTFANSSWCLSLYPNGQTIHSSTGWLGLYLFRKGPATPTTLYFTFGLKTSDGAEKKKEQKFLGEGGSVWGFPECWSRTGLKNRESTLMPNKVLTITCDLRMDAPSITKNYSDSSTQTDKLEIGLLFDVRQSSEKQGKQELEESLKRLLAGGEDSDCVLSVRGKEFPVHKAVLRARSPVFRAMFAHDTLERQSNKVTIEDCDPESFHAFLEHVYAGGVGMISIGNVFGLYAASEKYELLALKKACSEFAKENLTAASFCETITVAVKYDDKELVEVATDFYCCNTLDIVKTVEWQVFMVENPTVANELYIKQLTR